MFLCDQSRQTRDVAMPLHRTCAMLHISQGSIPYAASGGIILVDTRVNNIARDVVHMSTCRRSMRYRCCSNCVPFAACEWKYLVPPSVSGGRNAWSVAHILWLWSASDRCETDDNKRAKNLPLDEDAAPDFLISAGSIRVVRKDLTAEYHPKKVSKNIGRKKEKLSVLSQCRKTFNWSVEIRVR